MTGQRLINPHDQVRAYTLGKAGVVTQGGLERRLKELGRYDQRKTPQQRLLGFDVPTQGADFTADSTMGGGTSYVTATNWTLTLGGDQSWLVQVFSRVTIVSASGTTFSVRHNIVVDFAGGTNFGFCNVDDFAPAPGVFTAATSLDDFKSPASTTEVFSLKAVAGFAVRPGQDVAVAARVWTGTAATTANVSLTNSVFAPRFVAFCTPKWSEDFTT